MNNYWRIQAKHTTVATLPRLHQNRHVIVREDGYAKWSHAVCPGLVRIERARSDEEHAVTRTEIKFTEEGITA